MAKALQKSARPITGFAGDLGDVKKFDTEGRLLAAHYDDFVLLNVYFPNGGGGPERLKYKLDFYDAFLEHIELLRNPKPSKDGRARQKVSYSAVTSTPRTRALTSRDRKRMKRAQAFFPKNAHGLMRSSTTATQMYFGISIRTKRMPTPTGI